MIGWDVDDSEFGAELVGVEMVEVVEDGQHQLAFFGQQERTRLAREPAQVPSLPCRCPRHDRYSGFRRPAALAKRQIESNGGAVSERLATLAASKH